MSEVEKFNCMLVHGFPCMMPKENGLWVQSANFDDAQSELAALLEELATTSIDLSIEKAAHIQSKQRLKSAEERNASIVGKVGKCKECGSDSLFWFDANTNTSGIAEGRLRTSEVTCTFVLGCADCSATIKTVRADTIAARMTAALKPTESGASE